MEALKEQLRSQADPRIGGEALRKRSKRIRSFLNIFGAKHWAERVQARRPIARRGRVAL